MKREPQGRGVWWVSSRMLCYGCEILTLARGIYVQQQQQQHDERARCRMLILIGRPAAAAALSHRDSPRRGIRLACRVADPPSPTPVASPHTAIASHRRGHATRVGSEARRRGAEIEIGIHTQPPTSIPDHTIPKHTPHRIAAPGSQDTRVRRQAAGDVAAGRQAGSPRTQRGTRPPSTPQCSVIPSERHRQTERHRHDADRSAAAARDTWARCPPISRRARANKENKEDKIQEPGENAHRMHCRPCCRPGRAATAGSR